MLGGEVVNGGIRTHGTQCIIADFAPGILLGFTLRPSLSGLAFRYPALRSQARHNLTPHHTKFPLSPQQRRMTMRSTETFIEGWGGDIGDGGSVGIEPEGWGGLS